MISKAEKTRQFIIEKAAPLFNMKGYENTSLSDVLAVTGLTKGAIYGNFTDKNELAVAAYRHNASGIFSRIRQEVDAAPTPREALLAYSNYYAKNWQAIFKKGGCPLLNAAVEADDHLVFLKKSVRNSVGQLIKYIQQFIEKGQEQGIFRKNVEAGKYAHMIFMIIEGGIMLAKIMNDPAHLYLSTERINMIIEEELAA